MSIISAIKKDGTHRRITEREWKEYHDLGRSPSTSLVPKQWGEMTKIELQLISVVVPHAQSNKEKREASDDWATFCFAGTEDDPYTTKDRSLPRETEVIAPQATQTPQYLHSRCVRPLENKPLAHSIPAVGLAASSLGLMTAQLTI